MAEDRIEISIRVLDLPEVRKAINNIKINCWSDEEVLTLINVHVSDWCDEALLREYKIAMGKIT